METFNRYRAGAGNDSQKRPVGGWIECLVVNCPQPMDRDFAALSVNSLQVCVSVLGYHCDPVNILKNLAVKRLIAVFRPFRVQVISVCSGDRGAETVADLLEPNGCVGRNVHPVSIDDL